MLESKMEMLENMRETLASMKEMLASKKVKLDYMKDLLGYTLARHLIYPYPHHKVKMPLEQSAKILLPESWA